MRPENKVIPSQLSVLIPCGRGFIPGFTVCAWCERLHAGACASFGCFRLCSAHSCCWLRDMIFKAHIIPSCPCAAFSSCWGLVVKPWAVSETHPLLPHALFIHCEDTGSQLMLFSLCSHGNICPSGVLNLRTPTPTSAMIRTPPQLSWDSDLVLLC